jgi:hypothetical protein
MEQLWREVGDYGILATTKKLSQRRKRRDTIKVNISKQRTYTKNRYRL